MITPAGGLNLTMDELTHSAYDLNSGVTRYKYRIIQDNQLELLR